MSGRLGVGIAEAAEELGVSQQTLRKWADDGLIEHVRTPGGQRRFTWRAITEFNDRLIVHERDGVALEDR